MKFVECYHVLSNLFDVVFVIQQKVWLVGLRAAALLKKKEKKKGNVAFCALSSFGDYHSSIFIPFQCLHVNCSTSAAPRGCD